MLDNLSEQIRECLQHAEECARKATNQTDPRRFPPQWSVVICL